MHIMEKRNMLKWKKDNKTKNDHLLFRPKDKMYLFLEANLQLNYLNIFRSKAYLNSFGFDFRQTLY